MPSQAPRHSNAKLPMAPRVNQLKRLVDSRKVIRIRLYIGCCRFVPDGWTLSMWSTAFSILMQLLGLIVRKYSKVAIQLPIPHGLLSLSREELWYFRISLHQFKSAHQLTETYEILQPEMAMVWRNLGVAGAASLPMDRRGSSTFLKVFNVMMLKVLSCKGYIGTAYPEGDSFKSNYYSHKEIQFWCKGWNIIIFDLIHFST